METIQKGGEVVSDSPHEQEENTTIKETTEGRDYAKLLIQKLIIS